MMKPTDAFSKNDAENLMYKEHKLEKPIRKGMMHTNRVHEAP